MSFMFELGCEVVSKISGFKGVLTSRSEHLNGCNRYWVAPKVGKDGKLPDGYWMDEAEIKVTKETNLKPKNQERGGFPSRVK
jgi:hypothetical protein